MKIGIFDSGLGGLVITDTFIKKVKNYNYLYLGDTKNLPYGEKSSEDILRYTIDAVKFLIKNECKLIIIACNTASSIALRHIQQKFIPSYNPEIKVLGVVVPTVEEAIASSTKKIGVVATKSTVNSHIYEIEIKKINADIIVQELATPNLVPAIESNNFILAEQLVKEYVQEFTDIDSLILGCTHYPLLKEYFRKYLPKKVKIISQDDFMSHKLEDYILRHPEIENMLERKGSNMFLVTELNKHYEDVARQIIPNIKIEEVKF